MLRTSVSVLALGLFVLCAGNKRGDAPTTVPAATPAQQAALLDRVKSLAGTWEAVDESGKPKEGPGIVFAVSAGGSVVREIMFPGSPYEMVNVYHMDGPTMVMTHYCASGNQPRMRASAGSPDEVVLKFDSITNYTENPNHPGYMGGLTLVMKDKDHLTEKWTSYQEGKSPADVSFSFVRKADAAKQS
jgi:hypothetical protein